MNDDDRADDITAQAREALDGITPGSIASLTPDQAAADLRRALDGDA